MFSLCIWPEAFGGQSCIDRGVNCAGPLVLRDRTGVFWENGSPDPHALLIPRVNPMTELSSHPPHVPRLGPALRPGATGAVKAVVAGEPGVAKAATPTVGRGWLLRRLATLVAVPGVFLLLDAATGEHLFRAPAILFAIGYWFHIVATAQKLFGLGRGRSLLDRPYFATDAVQEAKFRRDRARTWEFLYGSR